MESVDARPASLEIASAVIGSVWVSTYLSPRNRLFRLILVAIRLFLRGFERAMEAFETRRELRTFRRDFVPVPARFEATRGERRRSSELRSVYLFYQITFYILQANHI